MIKINHQSVWYPHYLANSILDLNANELKRNGITHLVFDLDNTLVKKRSDLIAPDYVRHLNSLRSNGFILMLGSNRRHSIDAVNRSIEAIVVHPHGISMKPFKSFYKKVQLQAGTTPSHIAMIGDHIVNDVFGANRAGYTTVLVKSTSRTSFLNRLYIEYMLKQCVH